MASKEPYEGKLQMSCLGLLAETAQEYVTGQGGGSTVKAFTVNSTIESSV